MSSKYNDIMDVDFINGMYSPQMFGMQKYRVEITSRLPNIIPHNIEYRSVSNIPGVNQAYGLLWYPKVVRHHIGVDHIKHITRQDLAFINRPNLGKSVITCHDLIPIAYYGLKYKRHPVWSKNIRGMRNADHIITVSEFSKNDIFHHLNIPKTKISVIYNAVDHDIYYPNRNKSILEQYGIKNTQRVIMYVGAEEPRKNLLFLLKVLKSLKKDNPDIKLLKVGTPNWHGNVRKELMMQIVTLGLEDNVIFTGYVEEDVLAKLYNASDVFAFPSIYEGFGLPPLEAMACGTPTIVSGLSSLPEVVGDGALLANPYDLDKFSENIHNLLNDVDLRMTMIAKGIARAKVFTWEQSAKKTMEVYEMVNQY